MTRFSLLIILLCSSIALFGHTVLNKKVIAKRKAEYARGLPQVPLASSERVVSARYITGDAFRAMSVHVFDETDAEFDFDSVKPADTIFVNGDFLDLFFKHVHGRIKVPYILITHNSDHSFPGEFHGYLNDSKIVAWFTVNPSLRHPKIHPVPIGFQNHHWNKQRNADIDQALATKGTSRQHLLLMNFRAHTNLDERGYVFNMFNGVEYCYFPGTNRGFYDYLKDLSNSKYCLSPFGNGKDCHRVYESLVMGCIPIVKTSALDQLYESLPIMIINDWREVGKEFLNAKYDCLIETKMNPNFLLIDFWRTKIKEVGGSVIY